MSCIVMQTKTGSDPASRAFIGLLVHSAAGESARLLWLNRNACGYGRTQLMSVPYTFWTTSTLFIMLVCHTL